MKEPLTKTQKKTLDYLKRYFKRKGYMPSQREIAKRFRITLGGTTYDRLWSLEKKGYIQRSFNRARWIKLL